MLGARGGCRGLRPLVLLLAAVGLHCPAAVRAQTPLTSPSPPVTSPAPPPVTSPAPPPPSQASPLSAEEVRQVFLRLIVQREGENGVVSPEQLQALLPKVSAHRYASSDPGQAPNGLDARVQHVLLN